MSRQTSPSTRTAYGIPRVLRAWDLSRSTFYAQQTRRRRPATGRRGRTPTLDDAALLAHIRLVIADSPFPGEGLRKIWDPPPGLKGKRPPMGQCPRTLRDPAPLRPGR